MTRIRWTAGKDGTAHAHQSGRTACRVPSIGERHAWPTVTRCPACLAAVVPATADRGYPHVESARSKAAPFLSACATSTETESARRP
jgi:hypothetical protein